MLDRVRTFSVMAYLSVVGFFKDLKEDERGLDGIVIAVLLILVGVLAVVLIWGLLSGWLTELWDRITGAAEAIS